MESASPDFMPGFGQKELSAVIARARLCSKVFLALWDARCHHPWCPAATRQHTGRPCASSPSPPAAPPSSPLVVMAPATTPTPENPSFLPLTEPATPEAPTSLPPDPSDPNFEARTITESGDRSRRVVVTLSRPLSAADCDVALSPRIQHMVRKRCMGRVYHAHAGFAAQGATRGSKRPADGGGDDDDEEEGDVDGSQEGVPGGDAACPDVVLVECPSTEVQAAQKEPKTPTRRAREPAEDRRWAGPRTVRCAAVLLWRSRYSRRALEVTLLRRRVARRIR